MRPFSLLGLSLLLHAYIGLRVGSALPAPAALALALGLAVLAALVPAGLMARRLARHPASFRLEAVGLTALGLFSSLFVLTLLRDAGLLAAWVAAFAVRDLDTAAWARTSAAAVPLLALALTVLGFANARRTARVKPVDVPIANLPAALEGFTIAQISDLHVGPTIRRPQMEALVAAVNALEADVVAITGDLVDGSVAELREHVAPLAGLRARHGAYFVTGNHEYYAGAGPWIAEVRRLGIRVLLNEHVVIEHGEHGHAALVLAGVPDYMAHRFDRAHQSDPVAALRGAPVNAGVRILLAHQPRSAAAAAEAGFDLQLSGHTHGGQFLPWGFFVRFQQPFTFGLHRVGRMWIYVSRGTGYWGPPKRIGAPSEITRLRLVRAHG
jgi:predicted MPP superfamily phosphohydrolase